MVNWNQGVAKLSHKKVFVLGAARSGISAAHLLLKLGAEVVINDAAQPKSGEHWVGELREKGTRVIVGEHPEGLLDEGFDLIVKNPGISYRHPYLLEAAKRGIPVVTEIELGYWILEGLLIGITGSNGKTTTTTLVGEMFQQASRETIVAGNIGHVFSEQVQASHSNTVIVTELSSFQLKGTNDFRPHIACLLNLYQHHLDYHETYEDYTASKLRLFQNQRETDYAVLNWDQEQVRNQVSSIKAQLYWFSTKEFVPQGVYIADAELNGSKERWIYYKQASGSPQPLLPVSSILLLGEHNLENVLASIMISLLGGVEIQHIIEVLEQFRGVEHRLEFVAEKHGVRYYNDSKATNPEATQKAIQSFSQPIILIAGGLERGENLEELIPLLRTSVHTLISYGETKERLYEMAKRAEVGRAEQVDGVQGAVLRAAELAQAGDLVLLSPACASWDLYSSFEERGRIFKQAVNTL